MRKPIFSLVTGAFAGAALVGWFSPSVIAWYFNPPVEMGVTCKDAVVWGIDVYRKAMLVGGVVGVVLAGVALVWFKVKAGKTAGTGSAGGGKIQ